MAYTAPDESAASAPKAEAVDLPSLSDRIEWFEDWEEKTRKNRELARQDRDYYDGKQWSAEDLLALKERHQPPIVKNRIARKINFILGEEIRKRVDPVARPRTPQHEDSARAATDALRYIEEEQKFDQARSAVLKNMLVEGMGGAIKEIERQEDGPSKHLLTHVEWDRLFYDPHSRRPDFSDAKYLGIVIWKDLDDALLDYPDAADDLQAAISRDVGPIDETTEDTPRRWSDKRRQRIKIVEMYFRIGKDWYRSDFTKGADLMPPERTAYLDEKKRHSACPLKMASCYIDAEGMRYGVVRQLISPQDEINKRSSKALHLLSVRQVLAERDYILDPNKFQLELAKPDGFIEVEVNGLMEKRVEIMQTGDLANGQVQLLQEAKADIDAIGPSSANMPDLPESSSGRAFLARQQAASQELGPVFDALRNWTLSIYELDWLCARLEWSEEMWLRVTDDQELTGYRFVALNRRMSRAERLEELLGKDVPLEQAMGTAAGNMASLIMVQAQRQLAGLGQVPPEKQQEAMTALLLRHPMMAEEVTENQVDQMLVDIIVDEAPESATIAQEQFEVWTQLAPSLIQAGFDPREAAATTVELSEFRNKRKVLEALRKPPDPQAAQMQQQQQMLAMKGAEAGVQVQMTQAQLNAAKAAAEQAKVQIAGAKAPSEIEKNQASAMRDAAQAGEKAAGGAAPMETQWQS